MTFTIFDKKCFFLDISTSNKVIIVMNSLISLISLLLSRPSALNPLHSFRPLLSFLFKYFLFIFRLNLSDLFSHLFICKPHHLFVG